MLTIESRFRPIDDVDLAVIAKNSTGSKKIIDLSCSGTFSGTLTINRGMDRSRSPEIEIPHCGGLVGSIRAEIISNDVPVDDSDEIVAGVRNAIKKDGIAGIVWLTDAETYDGALNVNRMPRPNRTRIPVAGKEYDVILRAPALCLTNRSLVDYLRKMIAEETVHYDYILYDKGDIKKPFASLKDALIASANCEEPTISADGYDIVPVDGKCAELHMAGLTYDILTYDTARVAAEREHLIRPKASVQSVAETVRMEKSKVPETKNKVADKVNDILHKMRCLYGK